MRTVGADAFYYMYNAHADVTALLDSAGEVAATYDYDPFGNILEQTGNVSNTILFAGYQYDEETGLYYLNARMYDPVTARFLQEDTFMGNAGDPLSLNLYTYCYNSPMRYYDPTGHKAQVVMPSGLFGMPSDVAERLYGDDQDTTEGKKLTKSSGSRSTKNLSASKNTNNSTTYIQSNQPVVNSAGEAQYINYLELQKENDQRESEKRNTTITDYLKNDSAFAKTKIVEDTIAGAIYMGSDNYLSAMEMHIRNWEEGKQQEITIEDLIETINSLKLANDDVALFWQIYENTPMTDKQERVLLQIGTSLGVKYEQTTIPDQPPYTHLDCSALMLTGFRDANLKPPVSLPRKSTKQTEQGVLVYDAQKDGNLDFSLLQPGDIIGYDLHKYDSSGAWVYGHDDVVDHVGVFFGYDDKGNPRVIDASSSGVSIRSIYVGSDKENIERIVRVI